MHLIHTPYFQHHDPHSSVCVCFCDVSGNGEARGCRASWPDSDSGPWTRPAHISKQRGSCHPECSGGNLAPRPAALPASQWPPAQLPAQRQHARLWERWVTNSPRPTSWLVKKPGKPGPCLTAGLIIMLYCFRAGYIISGYIFFFHAHSIIIIIAKVRKHYNLKDGSGHFFLHPYVSQSSIEVENTQWVISVFI